jgi:hypothetical protein
MGGGGERRRKNARICSNPERDKRAGLAKPPRGGSVQIAGEISTGASVFATLGEYRRS